MEEFQWFKHLHPAGLFCVWHPNQLISSTGKTDLLIDSFCLWLGLKVRHSVEELAGDWSYYSEIWVVMMMMMMMAGCCLCIKHRHLFPVLLKAARSPFCRFCGMKSSPDKQKHQQCHSGRIKLVGETKYTHKINTVSLHSFYITQMTLIKDALSWKTLKHSHDAWSCFFLPLWRDVLEYTCLLGYRGEEVNWFSVGEKKWSERREKDTVSVTSKYTLKPAQWMCVNEYQII